MQLPRVEDASNAPNNTSRRYAYVTLFSHDNYLDGVLALHRSARLVNHRHPLVIMVTNGVSSTALNALIQEGCLIRHVAPFHPDGIDKKHYVRQLYAECWNKLRMWEWEDEFDKLVYLDADMIVLKNLDHLFELPSAPLYAVGDCYGGRVDAFERDACCHFSPESTPEYFNAGFYVMQPDKAELANMVKVLTEAAESGEKAAWRFAEQDFLNIYFNGRWKHLPYIYNAQKRIKHHHPDMWDLNEIGVIHYVDEKPWSHRFSEENMMYREEVELWWKVFEQGKKEEKKDQRKSHLRTLQSPGALLDIPTMQMAAARDAFAAREA